jgi:hypothetical protein
LQSIADTDRELKALMAEELALHQDLDGSQIRVENGPKRQEEIQGLSREDNATKERDEMMLKRDEEAQLAASLEQAQKVGQFRIFDVALAPRDPVAPIRLRPLATGLVLSIGLAVGAVLLSQQLDTTSHNIEDLRAFVSVPMLIGIPLIATATERRQRWQRFTLTTISIVVGLIIIIAGSRALAGNDQIVRLTARGHV